MSPPPALARTSSLIVRQRKEWTEIFTDIATANRYEILSPEGVPLLVAAEVVDGWSTLLRLFLKASRPFRIEVRDTVGAAILTVARPWSWWLSRCTVTDGSRRPLGTVRQRFSLTGRRYAILDAADREVASLDGALLRPWTFTLRVDGREVGRIAKRWGGLGREMFSDADTFGVEFSDAMGEDTLLLLLGATLLIDFVHFEDRG